MFSTISYDRQYPVSCEFGVNGRETAFSGCSASDTKIGDEVLFLAHNKNHVTSPDDPYAIWFEQWLLDRENLDVPYELECGIEEGTTTDIDFCTNDKETANQIRDTYNTGLEVCSLDKQCSGGIGVNNWEYAADGATLPQEAYQELRESASCEMEVVVRDADGHVSTVTKQGEPVIERGEIGCVIDVGAHRITKVEDGVITFVADFRVDSDGDGVPDVEDACPNQAGEGEDGCAVASSPEPEEPEEEPIDDQDEGSGGDTGSGGDDSGGDVSGGEGTGSGSVIDRVVFDVIGGLWERIIGLVS